MNDVTKDLLEALVNALRPFTYDSRMISGEPILLAARSALARAEAALAASQPDANGWIPWEGGECPVDKDDWVEATLRDGKSWIGKEAQRGEEWLWDHDGGSDDIVAYRVVKP